MNMRIPASVTLACAVLLSACATPLVSDTSLPVTVGSGFTLPSLLDEPEHNRNPARALRWLDQRWYAEAEVVGAHGQVVALDYCAGYLAAPEPLYPVRSQDMAAFSVLAVNCIAAELIATGKASRQSFIERRFVDESLPQRMPSMLAMVTSVSEWSRVDPEQSWGQVNAGAAFTATGDDAGRFSHGGAVQELAELARGDFTGDGLEDVLLTSFDYVQGGNHTARRLFLISRKSREQPFKVTQLYPR